MIIACLKNLEPYKILGGNLKTAIEYLESADFNSLEIGRHDVKGNEVYALVSQFISFNQEEREYETHWEYLDIHLVIEGEEYEYCCDKSKLSPCTEYMPEKDRQGFNGYAEEAMILMQKGVVAIYFPDDAHKVCCSVKGPKQVRKMVVKVKI